jgi:hypothetical protein
MLLGLLVIFFISIFVLFLRKKTQESNNTVLKTAMYVGDFFIWLRFLSFFFILMIVLLFVIIKSK